MLGRLLAACCLLVVSHSVSQLKDTIRGNINYRSKVSNYSETSKSKAERAVGVGLRHSKKYSAGDTIRENIDYRRQGIANSNTYKSQVWNHYWGFQTNSWFQKVLDSDSERIGLKNPIALTYSLNNIQSG